MKTLNKKIIAVIAIITVLTAGFMITACSKKKADTPVTPTEWTVTMDSTLTMTEGETKVLSFTSNQEGDFNVAWKSSDRNVVDFIKGSDGFATLTAKNAGTATMMLTIQKGTDTSSKQTLVCTVTVSEYKNDALRIVYAVDDSNASQYAIETNITEQGFKYNEEVSVKITPNKGYAFLSLGVGEEDSFTNYAADTFTKNTDGSYTLTFKANLKPTGSETTINVPVTVNMAQIIFNTQIDSAVTISGLSEDGYLIGQTLSLTATWVNSEDENTKICAVYYNSKEIFAEDGKYTFEVDSVINSLEVKTGKIESVLNETVTVAAGTSFIKSFPSISTRGVLIATFSYDQAKTATGYQFGVRLYNKGDFCTRIDLVRENDDFDLMDSATKAKYSFKNGENVQERLLNGTFGIGIERNGQTYNVWVTDGEEIVKAFEDLFITSSNSYWTSIGTTPGGATPVGSVIGLKYLYYDGQQGVEDYMHPVVSVTAKNATVAGVKTDDKLTLWNTAIFTVTADSGYKVSSVTLNDNILTATKVEEGVYTYTVVVTDPSKFDVTVKAVDPTAQATINWNNEKNLSYEIIEGEKDSYCATDEIKVKVTSTDKLIIFEGITQNGLPVSAQDGVYTITLEEGENKIAILAHSAVVTGASSGVQKPNPENENEKINTLVDVRSNIEQFISSPSPFGTLTTTLMFEEALSQTAETWRVDLRFYSTDNNSDFLPISIGKDKKGLFVSNRDNQKSYYNALGEGNYDENGVLTALANGTYRLAIVKTSGKTYTIYCDNGLGNMVLLGAIKGLGGISDTQYFYKIAFGGTSSGIVNNTLTCSIAWTWYDSITDVDFVLPTHYDLTVKANTSYDDEKVTVSGLNSEGYKYGDTVSFTVAAKTGFAISKVTVNGKEYTPATDGKVEFTFESYALNIVVESIFATIVPNINQVGVGTVSGLSDSYKVGDNASFTVTADNSTVYVTLNGNTLTAENGTYSFTVGEKIELDIKIIKNDKATVEIDADDAFNFSGVDTNVNFYDVQSVVSLTVSLKDYSGYDKSTIVVKYNGTDITANEGTYQITLAGGLNTISVTATKFAKLEKVVASGSTKSNADTETDFNKADETLNAGGVYVLKLTYTDTTNMKNTDKCVLELRASTGDFFVAGALLYSKENGFYFVPRKADNTSTRGAYATLDGAVSFGTENTDAIFEKLAAGTWTVVIVNDAETKTQTYYADNGTGTLVKVATFTNRTFNLYKFGFSQYNTDGYKVNEFQNGFCGYSAYYYADTTDLTVCPELAGFTVPAE